MQHLLATAICMPNSIWFNVTYMNGNINIPVIQLLLSELNHHQFNVQTNLMSHCESCGSQLCDAVVRR